MLNYRNPDHLHMGAYLEQFSQHRRSPLHAIGREPLGAREKLRRSQSATGALGPGAHRYPTDFGSPVWDVQNAKDELDAHVQAGHRTVERHAFAMDKRLDKHGMLKGISPEYQKKTNPLGPGQYRLHPVGDHHSTLGDSRKSCEPAYTIYKAKETAEALRQRKMTADNPGAGTYEAPSHFDEVGRERQKAIDNLGKKQKLARGCWASHQYSHIFNCMKPRGPGVDEFGVKKTQKTNAKVISLGTPVSPGGGVAGGGSPSATM